MSPSTPHTAPPRCAALSLARGDEKAGTAAPALRWLLVEQPGPWGRDALMMSRIDRDVATRLHTRARDEQVRVMLLRRPGRARAAGPRRFGWAESRPGQESLRWGHFVADRELLDLPFDGTAGEPDDQPAYLVCTHGRHDACCAIRGRPVAAALARSRPMQTWECSHTGGDRFAANLVVLPHGLYYGTVTVQDVPDVLTAHESGRVVPELLRGRSVFSAPTQAAQLHARLSTGDMTIDGLLPRRATPAGAGLWRVVLSHSGGDIVVTVARRRSAPVARLTCGATGTTVFVEYELVSIEPAGTGD